MPDDADPLRNPREELDWISVRGLAVECLIGAYSEERDRHQIVVVDLSLGLRPPDRAYERIAQTIDYVALAGQVEFLLLACQFRLVETAADAIARYLLAPPSLGERRARAHRVVVEMHKPAAMRPPTTANVSITRSSSDVEVARETKNFGTVDVVLETAQFGIYRLNVAPGATIPLHIHRKMQEHELVLTDGLICQGERVHAGTMFRWPQGAPHSYVNPTSRHQTILCVDRPAFIPDDEVQVSDRPVVLTAKHLWGPRGPDGWALGTDAKPGSRR